MFPLCIFLCAFFFPQKVYAVSVSITSFPATITQDMFNITASISGAGNGTNYLRVDIYKDGTTNYFGETFNGTDLYSGSDYHSYLPITISGSSWNGIVQGNLGSPSSTQYDGTGIYRLRLRRYTSGGSVTSSEADASSIVITIVTPTPSPTPIPTAAPTATPINTVMPTNKPTVTSTTKPSPTITVRPDITNMVSTPDALLASGEGILGTSISAQPTLVKAIDEKKIQSGNFLALLLIVGGILVLASCGILWYHVIKEKRGIHEDSYNKS